MKKTMRMRTKTKRRKFGHGMSVDFAILCQVEQVPNHLVWRCSRNESGWQTDEVMMKARTKANAVELQA
jgi:hypothetical protein